MPNKYQLINEIANATLKEILEQKFMDSIEKAKIQLEQRNNIEDKE